MNTIPSRPALSGTAVTLLTAFGLASPLLGQKLRRAVDGADLVVVGQTVRVIPLKKHVIHRVKIKEILRGPEHLARVKHVAVIETKRVSQHNKPIAAKLMLMCLHDLSHRALLAEWPDSFGPYFKMSGHPGSAVVLDSKIDTDPRLEFARVLVASHKGAAPRSVTERLFSIALLGDKRIRIEAAQTLAERPVLGGYLTSMHLSKILAKATGELDDIRYKIAMATICVERKVSASIPSLCVSVEHVGDRAFLRALGRFARYLHREKAAEVLLPFVQRAQGKIKTRMIYALGATSTEKALTALLEYRRRGTDRAAVDAALRVHGSPRATAALAGEAPAARRSDGEQETSRQVGQQVNQPVRPAGRASR